MSWDFGSIIWRISHKATSITHGLRVPPNGLPFALLKSCAPIFLPRFEYNFSSAPAKHLQRLTLTTSQAVHMAIEEHPRVGSRLIHHEGAHWFHLNAAEISVRLISVTPDVLTTGSPAQWQHVCETMTAGNVRGAALFGACLLASSDPSAGSVLVAGKACACAYLAG